MKLQISVNAPSMIRHPIEDLCAPGRIRHIQSPPNVDFQLKIAKQISSIYLPIDTKRTKINRIRNKNANLFNWMPLQRGWWTGSYSQFSFRWRLANRWSGDRVWRDKVFPPDWRIDLTKSRNQKKRGTSQFWSVERTLQLNASLFIVYCLQRVWRTWISDARINCPSLYRSQGFRLLFY